MEKPLVSFCVTTYNQSDCIEAALAGAFAQTYRPLEIVISDDCSTDGADRIIRRRIEEYRSSGGDVPIVYNRNETNLGNLGNWLAFGELAHGELLVKADGDDISLPQRTELIVDAWLANGKKAKIVSHRGMRFDENGRSLGPTWMPSPNASWGALQAWSPECWSRFAKLRNVPKNAIDDTLFAVRAMALSDQCGISVPGNNILVYYRMGSGITSRGKYREHVIRLGRGGLVSYELALSEINAVKNEIPEKRYAAIKEFIDNHTRTGRARLSLADPEVGMWMRIRNFMSVRNIGWRGKFVDFFRLLPPPLGNPALRILEMRKRRKELARYGMKLPDWILRGKYRDGCDFRVLQQYALENA